MKYCSIIIVTDPYTQNKQAQGQPTQIQNHDLHFLKLFLFISGPFGLMNQLVWVGTLATSHADSPEALFYKPRITTWSRPCFHRPCSLAGTREDRPTGMQMGGGSRDIRNNMSMPPPTVPIQMMMSWKLTSAHINSLKHPASTVKIQQKSCNPQIWCHHMTNRIKSSRQTCSKYLKMNYEWVWHMWLK